MISEQESSNLCTMPAGSEFSKSKCNTEIGKQQNVTEGSEAEQSPSAINSSCSSAKQHRKMQPEEMAGNGTINFEHNWTQTDRDVTLTIHGLSEEQTRAVDVSFTSKEVCIKLKAADKRQVIQFYEAIHKEESRVQATKGSIILKVLKQQPRVWPQLEKDGSSSTGGFDENELTVDKMLDSEIAPFHSDTEIKDNQGVSSEIQEKEEEPVFHLSHLKNDYYERGFNLTLSVYTKCLNKDAVKMNFQKHGFVLKFQTSDTKFLQLHEGTTADTVFTWPVTTRHEIIPYECKYTVKTAIIEIQIKKTSPDRWISLEAPLRKEKTDQSQPAKWIPITGAASASSSQADSASSSSSQTTNGTTAAAASSSTSHTATFSGVTKIDTSVEFDEMADIDVKASNNQYVGSTSVMRSQQQQEEDENGGGSFSFDYSTQKPTAKVSPLNNQASEAGMVIPPGYAGLVNVGNTCFMNCIIQVLANTREFRDFFLDGRFQNDINEDNPLGMKGQLAATFGVLLRWLWSCRKHYWDPRRLKDLVSKKNPQFFGYAQHDAHEFLAFLLDGLHEDLNRIKKKPYTETVDSNGRPDKVVADEAWAQYKLRNDSVVVDMFQGQFKSKLVCPKCDKVSITFDPFLYMSVPLPKKKKVIPVHFIWKESYKKPVKYLIQVSQDSTVDKLKEELSNRTRVKPIDIRVFEAYRGRILKSFVRGTSLANVEQKDVIIACEILSEEVAGEEVLEIPVMQRTLFPSNFPSHCAFCRKPCMEGAPLKRCTKCYKVGYCDQSCQRNHWNLHKSSCSTSPDPIGCPFILSIPASRATYTYLMKHMEAFSRFSVDIFQPPVKSSSSSATNSTTCVSDSTKQPMVSGGMIGSSSTGCLPAPQAPSSSASLPAATNLSSCSLSQSSSSLNSLDSLSSASSTCTLTGDQSDTGVSGAPGSGDDGSSSASVDTSHSPRYASPCPPQAIPQASHDNTTQLDVAEACRSGSVDSGFESIGLKSGEKAIPVSSVLGVQAMDNERGKSMPTFYIKPVSMEGHGLKGSERLEDKGDTPLDLISGRFLSMDWRNNEKLPSYVLVQSKELECEEVDNLNNMATASSTKTNLYDCLELFTEPEVLNPEEAWYCPSCKKHVEASKQMSIWQLPHTLVIQLKRFSFQNFLMRSKIKKHIDFPTRGLDLSQYCVGQQPGEAPPIYDLYGVANHHGLLIGGHYTSYVRCSGLGQDASNSDEIGWRLCNDSRVTAVNCEKSVVTSDAYLLFYRRRCPVVIGTTLIQNTNSTSAIPHLSQYIESQQSKGSSNASTSSLSTSRGRIDSAGNDDYDDADEDSRENKKTYDNIEPRARGRSSLFSTGNSMTGHEDIGLTNQLFLERQMGGTFGNSGTLHDSIKLHNKVDLSSFTSGLDDNDNNDDEEDASPEIFDVNLKCKDVLLQQKEKVEQATSSTEEANSEKKDAEKTYWDSDKDIEQGVPEGDYEFEIEDDDEEEEDGEGSEKALVIASESELDYTDMEAVD